MPLVAKMEVSAKDDTGAFKAVGHGQRTFGSETHTEDAKAEIQAWIERNQNANKKNPDLEKMRWKVDLLENDRIIWTYEVPTPV